MNDFVQSLLAVAALLALVFGPALAALWFVQRRKRIARRRPGAKVVYDGKALAFLDRSGTKAIERAARQGKWLAKWLQSSTGHPVRVTPVLALPGWCVDRKGRGEVLVFSSKELRGGLLKARSAEPLSVDEMQRVVRQVEQRCRDVEPNYRPQEG